MPTKSKNILPKTLKEHRMKFGNNHNHVVLIIQKPILLLN